MLNNFDFTVYEYDIANRTINDESVRVIRAPKRRRGNRQNGVFTTDSYRSATAKSCLFFLACQSVTTATCRLSRCFHVDPCTRPRTPLQNAAVISVVVTLSYFALLCKIQFNLSHNGFLRLYDLSFIFRRTVY